MNQVIIIFKNGEKLNLNNVYCITTNGGSMTISYRTETGVALEYPAIECISTMLVG